MRILAFETHFPDRKQTNAADWWRTIRPFQELQKRTDWEIDITKGVLPANLAKDPHSPQALREWTRIGMNYDLIHFSYNHSAMFYSFLAVVSRKFGHKLNIDYDDNVLRQDLLNPTVVMSQAKDPYEHLRIDVILKDVDGITVTSDLLKNEYANYIKPLKIPIDVIPNYIDLDLYKPVSLEKNKELTIGFFGSTSHQADLNDKRFIKAISYIRKKYKVKFEIIGNYVPGYLNGLAPTKLIEGTSDFYKWVDIWKENVCHWDIGIAPNRNTAFNRSRSNIKYQELAAANIPTVASDIGLYDNSQALLADTTQDWITHLSHLIEDKNFRLDKGQESYDDVKSNWTIQGNWEKWRDAIEGRVNRK